MTQVSHWIESDSVPKQWLEDKVYSVKKTRSLKLAQASIQQLKALNKLITVQTIHDISKEIDPEKKGIHRNTIRTNPDVYQLYMENRSHSITRTAKRRTNPFDETYKHYLKHIKQERDLQAVLTRYRRLSKQELIDRLITCEQYVAEAKHKWLLEQFQSDF